MNGEHPHDDPGYPPPAAAPQPFRSQFDRRLLLFLWRHLTLSKIAIAFTLTFAAFWVLAAVRLTNPSIRGRMHFAAKFLTIKESDPVAAARRATDTLAQLRSEWPGFAFHLQDYRLPGTTTAPAVLPTEQDFIAAAAQMSLVEDGSYEFREAVDRFNSFSATWYDRVDPELSIRPDIAHDDQLRGGAAVSLQEGSTAELRHDAREFVQNYRMFDGQFAAATDQAKLRPWTLFRFYDPKRYLLSHELPIAFGTLLLACSLLLQFRFIDLSRTQWHRSDKIPLPKRAIDAKWPKVWSRGAEWQPDAPPDQRAVVADENVDALVPAGHLKLWVILAAAAASLIELILDVPGVRAEWVVNVPLISAVAIILVIIWSTLFEIGRWDFDGRGIGAATRECRTRMLRPFLLGGAALLAATAWMVSYSLLVLPVGRAESVREIVQVFISVVTLVLLVRVGGRLHRQWPPGQALWKISDAEEESLNAEKTGVFDSVLPHIDENLIKALLLAIVPFASLFESLFG